MWTRGRLVVGVLGGLLNYWELVNYQLVGEFLLKDKQGVSKRSEQLRRKQEAELPRTPFTGFLSLSETSFILDPVGAELESSHWF